MCPGTLAGTASERLNVLLTSNYHRNIQVITLLRRMLSALKEFEPGKLEINSISLT